MTEQPHRPLQLTPARYRAARGRPYAVVDVGSNSVRLVIYDRLGRAPFPLFNEKSMCRLGAGLAQTGRLADAAIERTVAALTRFAAIAKAMRVGRIDVLATEAARRAENGADLIDRIRAETGMETRILAGGEEARYSALGVISGFYRPAGLICDIGGGSVDLATVDDDSVGPETASLPIGALPVSALMREQGRDARKTVDAALAGALDALAASSPGGTFYTVGGGWRALAAVHMARAQAPVRVVHGYTVPGDALRALAKEVSRMDEAAIANLAGAPGARVDTLAASALVLDRMLRLLKPQQVVFSVFGLREGWLYGRLPKAARYQDPLLDIAQAFAYDNSRVPEFTAALADWTAVLFPEETAAECRLRVAACALSDIAWRDHRSVKALQTYRRLIEFPLAGITHGERVFLGAVLFARHGGRCDDPALAPENALLTPDLARRAEILGRALRLAYRYAGCVPEILVTARLRIDAQGVGLAIAAGASVPDSEAVQARLKLLAKSLGLPVAEPVAGTA
ncbi:MAG: hypothetical protein ACFCVH_02045 [Alphaproteobacteria bacterium]